MNNLISVALLRAAAAEAGITDIAQKQGQLVFTLARFSLEQFSALCAMGPVSGTGLLLTPGGGAPLYLPAEKGGGRPAGPHGRWWTTSRGRRAEAAPHFRVGSFSLLH